MLPSEVKVGAHRVPIVYKPELGDEGDEHVSGLFFPQDFHIEIRSGMRPARTAEVLMHETLHAINATYGFVGLDEEERAVQTLGCALTKLAQDNPEFIRAWLSHAAAST